MKRLPIKTVDKLWGSEEWIVNNELYCGKILRITAGHYSSWHYHLLKSETFQVVKGELTVFYSFDDDISKSRETTLMVGECMDIPVGLRHRLCAFNGNVEFLEISTHHEDSDSYRLEPGF